MPEIGAGDWPVYSVLVPLFREVSVLPQLVTALRRLRYPPDRLDIKLILEEEDIPMQRAVARLALEDFFEVIVVPAGLPQTKPRALNYALQFCRGELLTIYDAEDIPEPDQLEKSARRFAAAPRELAQHIELEKQLLQSCAETADAREGVQAFLAKRSPHFQGH